MVLCTLTFTLFALPVGNGIGTQILEKIFQAPSNLAAIRTLDEAVVIGAALSLSSSAFVLQLLSENGELASKFGSATLGILLLQVTATLHLPFADKTWSGRACWCRMHMAIRTCIVMGEGQNGGSFALHLDVIRIIVTGASAVARSH